MFAMLRRHDPKSLAKTSVPPLEPLPIPHAQNSPTPIGASMKFQYGSGDTPLEGYKIKRGVGSGGFGEVYFAESDSGKEVALKRIQKNLEVEVRGVRHCLNLRHPNLVAIYDIKFDKLEQGWIVMEYIDGNSLRDRMDHEPHGMAAADAMQNFAQMLAGVAYLHDQGIVHRDLKPANVFIDGGLVKIGDYGLSKYISASRRGGQTESVGTFHYMAPEIGKGEYGKEIDIYSLGIIIYEMLAGNVPFDGESSQEIILKHLTADPDLSLVPQPFAGVIQKALAKNPASRFRDCREMLAALGWELDPSGLAVKSLNGEPPLLQPLHQAAAGKGIPVARPVMGSLDVTTAGTPNRAANVGSSNPWRYRYGQTHTEWGAKNTYREPIARAIYQVFLDVQQGVRSLPPGGRAMAIVAIVLMLVLNSGVIAPLLFLFFGLYVMYYFVWYIAGGANKPIPTAGAQPLHQANRPVQAATPGGAGQQTAYYQAARPVAAVAKPIPYKVALRNWQNNQRGELRKRSFWTRSHAYTRPWAFSGLVTLVLAFGASMLSMARNEGNAHSIITGIAWTGIMSLLITWTVLFLTRRWESKTEDSVVFRFVQLSAGIALGIVSFALSQYLMVPWSEITSSTGFGMSADGQLWSKRWWGGFYAADSTPLLAGHIAYFGALMWLVRWWRQSDILRRSRFSLWAIAWSVGMAALVQGLFYFPGPWCYILAGVTSFTLQMASPWIEYQERESSIV